MASPTRSVGVTVYAATGRGGTLGSCSVIRSPISISTAAEARENVDKLQAERAIASLTGVDEIPSYMQDLEEELELWQDLYTTLAVTEIASLRGQLSGPQLG